MIAAQQDYDAMVERTNNRDNHRQHLLETMAHNRQYKEDVDKMQTASWHKALNTDAERLEQDLRVERRALAREQSRVDRVRKNHSDDFEGGVDWFEANLQRLEKEAAPNAEEAAPAV